MAQKRSTMSPGNPLILRSKDHVMVQAVFALMWVLTSSSFLTIFPTRPFGPKVVETMAPYMTRRADLSYIGGKAGRCSMRQWSVVRTL